MGYPTVSVIIPTLNAAREIENLLDALRIQTVRPDEVLIIDSSSEDCTRDKARQKGADVIQIAQSEFDHGATRHTAIGMTKGEYVIFLTQDAVPANNKLVENLLSPFSDDLVAMSYGRQLPRSDARGSEKLVREFNYPVVSHVRSKADIESVGIKAFFASDTCAAYRRSAYIRCGGFERPCATNEDMFMAAKFLGEGYKVAYAADAEVVHSHNLTLKQQFRRNYNSAKAMRLHSELLGGVSPTSEGIRLVREVGMSLLKERKIADLVYFLLDCTARFAGSKLGGASHGDE